ncbi:unnamed protein product [Adineta steineri]|uniref:Glucosidase 2 subunit beta n=2 Tax=Adineta steineri TaxID=433720 RepID=A0A819C159_9BILA|nr:unnamed protein product [Adineta steineri]CAF3803704.1 unnamed protein product [Adineta steineri]
MFPSYVNLVLVSCLFISVDSGNVEQIVLRGVQTSLLSMYIPSKPFTCLDGSLTIPYEFVNDDYCDCKDGTDEPGTSACPNGRFFCENKGYVGSLIPSHFVGDGVCDCCDGSDEYETKTVCNNTCFELAQKTQAEREAQRVLHEAGVAKKKEIISKSIAIKSERQTHIDELERDLQSVENELKEKEELKRQAEIPENQAKEKHQKLWDEQRAVRETIIRNYQIRDMFADLDTNGDSLVSIDELQKHTELDLDNENEFTIEEVRTILGSDSVTLDEFNTTVFDQISNSYKRLPKPTTPIPEPTLDSIATPSSPEETSTDEKNMESHDETPIATSLEHEKHIHDDTPPEFDDETKQLIAIADQTRTEFDQVQGRVLDIKRQIEDLKKQVNIDVGIQGEYSAFIDQCFDYEEREYTYRVCMFKDAKQIPKGGGGDVAIGFWDAWTGPIENKYLRMKYVNGATCWNGPARSLTVTFRCGIEHKIIDVREPSRCEYAMIFETPSACDEKMAASSSHSTHVEF